MGTKESHHSLYPGSEKISRVGARRGHYETLYRPKRDPVTRFRERISMYYPQIPRLDESEYNYIMNTVLAADSKAHDLSNTQILPLGRWDDATTIWQVKVRGIDMIVAFKKYGTFPITPLPTDCLYFSHGDKRNVFNERYNLSAHLGDRMTTAIPQSTSARE